MSTHATLVQAAGDGFTWTSNARTNLRTKKESWPNIVTHDRTKMVRLCDRSACAPRSRDTFSKDATLATTKLSKIIRNPKVAYPGTISRARFIERPIARLANGQRPTRQRIPPWKKCLTSLWPLAVACPPMSWLPLRRNRTIYRPAGAVSNFVQDRFYACSVGGQGPNLANFLPKTYPLVNVKMALIWVS